MDALIPQFEGVADPSLGKTVISLSPLDAEDALGIDDNGVGVATAFGFA